MSRYYRDQYGNYGETNATELPDSVVELTVEEYNEAINALIAEDEARAEAEEARKEAERQAREEAARRAAEEAARRAAEEAERQAQEAAREAARQAQIEYYTGKVSCGDLGIDSVPEEYRAEVESRLNPIVTIEERVEKLENPVRTSFSTVKYLPANTWVSVFSESVPVGSYHVVTDATSFKVYHKGVVIGESNPVFLDEEGIMSVQVIAETAGDYIVKLYKI